MDADRFDALSRSLTTAGSRRRALAFALSGALAPLLAGEATDAHDALLTCKKLKGAKKKKCLKKAKKHMKTHAGEVPSSGGGGSSGGCTPNCAPTNACGSDGCTGSCGTCDGGATCTATGVCDCGIGKELCQGTCWPRCGGGMERNSATCSSCCYPPGRGPGGSTEAECDARFCCAGVCALTDGGVWRCGGLDACDPCTFNEQCSDGNPCLGGRCGFSNQIC
jgi:hypothetical protein